MARPREFNNDTALEGALQIFWENGFSATNLPDLLKAMGLTRGSFYKAYGDKRSVYLEALKRYDECYVGQTVNRLTDVRLGPPMERILTMFNNNIDDRAPLKNRRGCLICNAMVELGPIDSDVAKITSSMWARIQNALTLNLQEKMTDKSLASQQATIITNLYFGSQAVSKTGASTPDWHGIIRTITMA
ncbi:TetR/AcrR family transcriptional regulator [Sneathiella aquimaris]|uniref:TetR/AcrR family transcriptional regulator n=1 Tax=Sneathiella aquimaris TaxID=2599305 RepID=UPI00146A9FFD|nr:TetR/AcrR family transcriptional regulator [Sneathiella aquimaris]